MYVHSGGLWNAVIEATESGSRAFGLFLGSQRTWKTKPLEPESADKFRKACCDHGFSPGSILPHGSYLLNCGSSVAGYILCDGSFGKYLSFLLLPLILLLLLLLQLLLLLLLLLHLLHLD